MDDVLQVNAGGKLTFRETKQKFFLFNDMLVRVYPQAAAKKQKEPRDVEATPLELIWIKKDSGIQLFVIVAQIYVCRGIFCNFFNSIFRRHVSFVSPGFLFSFKILVH